MVNKACFFWCKTTYVYLRLQHKQCKLVLKQQVQDYSGRIVNSRYAGGNWKIQCKLPPKTKRFCPLVLK